MRTVAGGLPPAPATYIPSELLNSGKTGSNGKTALGSSTLKWLVPRRKIEKVIASPLARVIRIVLSEDLDG